MRVLLAGGAGYIGAHTAVSLLDAGHYRLDVADECLPFTDGDVAVLIDEIIERVAHLLQSPPTRIAATHRA